MLAISLIFAQLLQTHHVCEGDVQEESGGDGRDPLRRRCVCGDGQSDVQTDEGGESAAHVQQKSALHRQTAVKKDRKITCADQNTNIQLYFAS